MHTSLLARAALLVGVALMACDNSGPTGAKQKRPVYPVPVYSGQIPASPAARDAEEQAALDRLFEISPAKHLEFLKKTLSSPDWNTQTSIVSVAGNPEAAQLLSKIYAIREARRKEQLLAERRQDAAVYHAEVTFALLRRVRESKIAAILTRTPRGDNIIGVFDSDLTPERIAQALRMLARSRAKDGDIPLDQVRAYADRGTTAPHASPDERAFASAVIAKLRQAEPRTVASYGIVPTISVTIGPLDSGHRIQ